jgi:FlaA1/EpsC-like NDP-sugar epimerase
MIRTRPGMASLALYGAIDVALVLVFVLIGRASHNENLLGTLNTLWPFVSGLAIGWIVTRAWRDPLSIAWIGVGVWISTVVVGMLLRILSGQGVQVSFIVVAAIVLGVFLLGWRWIAIVVLRRRAREHTPVG